MHLLNKHIYQPKLSHYCGKRVFYLPHEVVLRTELIQTNPCEELLGGFWYCALVFQGPSLLGTHTLSGGAWLPATHSWILFWKLTLAEGTCLIQGHASFLVTDSILRMVMVGMQCPSPLNWIKAISRRHPGPEFPEGWGEVIATSTWQLGLTFIPSRHCSLEHPTQNLPNANLKSLQDHFQLLIMHTLHPGPVLSLLPLTAKDSDWYHEMRLLLDQHGLGQTQHTRAKFSELWLRARKRYWDWHGYRWHIVLLRREDFTPLFPETQVNSQERDKQYVKIQLMKTTHR
jgi:hypothetical protein